jgi:ABC-type polysaccharide/polyol phosphate export permease
MLPIGKLTLWNQFDLTQINYFKLFLSFIFQNIFYACFVLWVASIIEHMNQFGSVWARYIFPLWFMGGFQFSWVALHHVLPYVAYINLLNPMIYITEAMRISLLGQDGYLNFWLSLLAIAFFSVITLCVGIRNLKRRLDFV